MKLEQLLGGAALLALMAGAAGAQTPQATVTQTPLAPPPVQGYGTDTRTERTTFGGASTEVERSTRILPGVSETTERQTVVHPDGATDTVSRSDATRAAVPPPAPAAPAWSSSTTTTTQTTTR